MKIKNYEYVDLVKVLHLFSSFLLIVPEASKAIDNFAYETFFFLP